ncbi:MAG TPA: prepilin-type N-terminal cleavage/methylation domain-containing protein [Gemmatimonadaceae bacterium]|nr:prepilin-type N-terminal cleavage/methylation domain-containing protein [Gemmatimonadaceae bacterium]
MTRRGLTLIEVMIAILIFAIGALGLAATSAVILRQMASSAQRSRAAHLSASLSEKTRAREK